MASTSWFVNFLKMAGVEKENTDLVIDQIDGEISNFTKRLSYCADRLNISSCDR